MEQASGFSATVLSPKIPAMNPNNPTNEWISNTDGQTVIVTKSTPTDFFWSAGGMNFKTNRATFEKNYTPKNPPAKNQLLVILEDGAVRKSQKSPDEIWPTLVDGCYEVVSIVDISNPDEPKFLYPNTTHGHQPVQSID